ncbi:MAG TPA: hypothetical protein VNX01_10610 [Bacteroidia bacterium]|nr:hypothetical protein [Bacteroidia bacterium]
MINKRKQIYILLGQSLNVESAKYFLGYKSDLIKSNSRFNLGVEVMRLRKEQKVDNITDELAFIRSSSLSKPSSQTSTTV